MAELNLKRVILACKRKECKAQRLLVDELASFLFSICLRYLKNEEDAKDAVQESLILVLNNISDFRSEPDKIYAWSKRIAINLSLSKIRKRRVHNHINRHYSGPYDRIEPKVIGDLYAEDIIKLLDQLAPVMREVFNLYIIDGYKHKHIAKMLGIKESSSRTILTRARRQLKELILQTEAI